MDFFSLPDFDHHEQVVFVSDKESGFKGIIGIHNSNRGPALGGCRVWDYATDEQALEDVLRLSKGMSYKNALANLPYGGGKAVIIGTPSPDKRAAVFSAMGQAVQRLSGRYITAEDVGTSPDDMAYVAQNTDYVVGLKETSGDPSPATAYGVYCGLLAAVKHRLNQDGVAGLKILVQGLGHVGFDLARQLSQSGAEILVTDLRDEIVQKAVTELGAKVANSDNLYQEDIDIYAPCALGATLNDETIPALKAKIVAGAANNQLARPERHGNMLKDRHILYAPDYAINAGGVINISHEKDILAQEANGTPILGYDREASFAHVKKIYNTLLDIFEKADKENIPTYLAADHIAEEKFSKKA